MPVAGVPSVRHDLPRPIAPSGRSRADIENLGDETSVKALVNPSVYTSFGLTYRDFFMVIIDADAVFFSFSIFPAKILDFFQ